MKTMGPSTPGAILVFLTGEEEIEHAVWRINSEAKEAVAQVP